MSSVFDFAKKNLGLAPDPKLTFKSTTLPHLHSSSRPIPPGDTSYWSTYYSVFDFPSDVPTLISLPDLRKAIKDHPDNVANLVKVLVAKLDSLVHSPSTRKVLQDKELDERGRDDGPNSPSNTTLASQLKGFGQRVPSTLFNGAVDLVGVGGSNKAPKGPLREILNCVRVLTRVLPVLMEDTLPGKEAVPATPTTNGDDRRDPSWRKSSDKAYWVNKLFWATEPDSVQKDQDTVPSSPEQVAQPQFVIDEEEGMEEEDEDTEKLVRRPSMTQLPTLQQPSPSSPRRAPLLVTLIETILDLLFLPGVCVPVPLTGASNTRYPIWTAGIGASQIPPDHSQLHNASKVEVLRLLLVVLSKPLYSPPHLYAAASPSVKDILGLADDQDPFHSTLSFPNPALSYLCTKTPKALLLALLCSLINTSLAPTKTGLISPASALSSIANGFGRMTQAKLGFNSAPSSSSTASIDAPRSDATGSPSGPPRRASASGASGSPHWGGASTVGVSEGLPGWCAALLSVLLLPEPTDGLKPDSSSALSPLVGSVDEQGKGERGAKVAELNGFRMYLSKLHRPSDLSFLADYILHVLMKPMTVTSQLLSSDGVGTSRLTHAFLNYGCGLMETVLLLYLTLDCNSRLAGHLISTRKIVPLMIGLTFICLEQKDALQPKVGLVRLCAVTLQLLTARERMELSHLVNEPVDLPVGIRAQYSVPGSLADFLIVSICSFIFTTNQLANSPSPSPSTTDSNPLSLSSTTPSQDPPPLASDNNYSNNRQQLISTYTALILTFTNLSPYLKELTSLSSVRICQLFMVLSSPSWVLRDEGNIRLVYYVLEGFNNIIQYQMPDNPHLIYSLIKLDSRFEQLGTFTLQEGLREISRVKCSKSKKQQQREEQEQEDGEGEVREGRSGMSEKAKGKEKRKEGRGGKGASEGTSGDVDDQVSNNSTLGTNTLADTTTTAASVGRNGFVATEHWVASWRDSLPLDTVQIMLSELKPKVMAISSTSSPIGSAQTLDLLRSATLVGLLPPQPHPRGRTFGLKTSNGLGWLGSQVWAVVFIHDSNGPGFLVGGKVMLIGVKHVQTTSTGRRASGIVEGLLKPFSSRGGPGGGGGGGGGGSRRSSTGVGGMGGVDEEFGRVSVSSNV